MCLLLDISDCKKRSYRALVEPHKKKPLELVREAVQNTVITTIEFDGLTDKYIFNWTRIVEKLGEGTVARWYAEAGSFTESLEQTFAKFEGAFKASNTANVNVSVVQECSASAHKMTVFNLSNGDLKMLPGYTGNFGITTAPIWNEILSTATKISTTHQSPFFSDQVALTVWKFENFRDISLAGYASKDYVNVDIDGKDGSATILFGLTGKLPPLKGFLGYSRTTVVSGGLYSLAVIAPNGEKGLPSLFKLNFTKLFMDLTLPLSQQILNAQNLIWTIEIKSQCHNNISINTAVEMFIKTAVAHFFTLNEFLPQSIHAGCIMQKFSELTMLQDMISVCLNMQTDFKEPLLIKVATQQANQIPFKMLGKLSDHDIDALMAMLAMSQSINVSDAVIFGFENFFKKMYVRYTETYSLTQNDRKSLFWFYTLLQSIEMEARPRAAKLLLTSYLLATSMCNNLEIANLVDSFSHKVIGIYETFSPCYLSMRYDFTPDKLKTDVPQTSEMTSESASFGIYGFMKALQTLHLTSVSLLPGLNCSHVSSKDIILGIPLTHVTYLLSSNPISGTTSYDIVEVFLKSTLSISVIKPDCTPLVEGKQHLKIPVVYNISKPGLSCPFCESVILSYDESQGFQSMMYVLNHQVQKNLFLDNSPFFANDNLHIHYLWLQSNGTVVEIRGTYRRRINGFVLLGLIICIFASLIYVGYKMLSLFLSSQ